MSPRHRTDRPALVPIRGGDRRNARASLRSAAILRTGDADTLSDYRRPREIAAFLDARPTQAWPVGARFWSVVA